MSKKPFAEKISLKKNSKKKRKCCLRAVFPFCAICCGISEGINEHMQVLSDKASLNLVIWPSEKIYHLVYNSCFT